MKLTNEYKTSLEKLIAIYETNVIRAEAKRDQAKKLLDEGLIFRVQLEENERAVESEREKLNAARRQATEADAQVAAILVESEAEKTIAKTCGSRGKVARTTSFTRFAGGSGLEHRRGLEDPAVLL